MFGVLPNRNWAQPAPMSNVPSGTCSGHTHQKHPTQSAQRRAASELTTATFALVPFDAEECCDQDGRCISVHAIEALRR